MNKQVRFGAIFIASALLMGAFLFWQTPKTYALEQFIIQLSPIPCAGIGSTTFCPNNANEGNLSDAYAQLPPDSSGQTQSCATSYADFIANPAYKHYWVEDPEVTAQGKADERARQFVYWVFSRSFVDEHPVLKQVWGMTSNIMFFLILLVAAVLGLGIIVDRGGWLRPRVAIWPVILKLGLNLLFITFSAAIIFFLVQFSEILMKFFIENLGGGNLFNIYFSSASNETNYTNFYGCRDLNIRVQEAAQAQMFLFKLTNVTYYVLGIALLLRKILLWFLLFVAPFASLLLPFRFIRNTAFIWIGVFFQWLFYGPLFALFLGGMNLIWQQGMPFIFDFSRTNDLSGYIYPTAINIVYGGPAQIGAQTIGALNNGNYVDTFAEYVIALLMLWAVILFPWWLLRIFRDSCCEGIAAMGASLRALADSLHPSSPTGPGAGPNGPNAPISNLTQSIAKLGDRISKISETNQTRERETTKLVTVQEIRQAQTSEISKSLSLSASKLTDIARLETNKQAQQEVRKNLESISNPARVENSAERTRLTNIRTELVTRAVKDDVIARSILAAASTDRSAQSDASRAEIVRTLRSAASESRSVYEKQTSISSSVLTELSKTNSILDHIAKNTNTSTTAVQQILSSLSQLAYSTKSAQNTSSTLATANTERIVSAVSQRIQQSSEKIANVLKETQTYAKNSQQIVSLSDSSIQNIAASVGDTVGNVKVALAAIAGELQKQASQPVALDSKTIVSLSQAVSQTTGPALRNIENAIVQTQQIATQTQSASLAEVAKATQQSLQEVKQALTAASSEIAKGVQANTSQVTTGITNLQKAQEQAQTRLEQITARSKEIEKQSQTKLQEIATATQTSIEAIKSILKAQETSKETEQLSVDERSLVTQVSTSTQLPAQTITNIITETKKYVSNLSQVSTQNETGNKVQNINQSQITQIAQEAQVQQSQVESILSQLNQARYTQVTISSQLIQDLSAQTKLSAETIAQVVNQIQQATTSSASGSITKDQSSQIALANNIQEVQVSQIQSQLAEYRQAQTSSFSPSPELVQQLASQNNLSTEVVTHIIERVQTIENGSSSSTTVNQSQVTQIAQATNTSAESVRTVLNQISQAIKSQLSSLSSQTANEISKQTNVAVETVSAVLEKAKSIGAYELKTADEKLRQIAKETKSSLDEVKSILAQIAQNTTPSTQESTITNISNTTNVAPERVKEVIRETQKVVRSATAATAGGYGTQSGGPRVNAQTGQQILQAAKSASTAAKPGEQVNAAGGPTSPLNPTPTAVSKAAEGALAKVAASVNMAPQQVAQALESVAEPVVNESRASDEGIESVVQVPTTMDIEDYEEVKQMWLSQYEDGEIPTTENVTSRREWVEQDVVVLTNTLNKLMSEDEALQQEGLNDLGFILPIFMVNNMKGPELLVYLKAKLQAAKLVRREIEKEEEIESRVRATVEAEVDDDFSRAKKAVEEKAKNSKHMVIDMETGETKVAEESMS